MKNPKVCTINTCDTCEPTDALRIAVDEQTFKNFHVEVKTMLSNACLDNLETQAKADIIKLNAFAINAASQEKIHNFLSHYAGRVVLDLSLVAMSTDLQRERIFALLPFADIIITSQSSAEKILSISLTTYQEIQKAAQNFLDLKAKSIIIMLQQHDYWASLGTSFWLSHAFARTEACPGINSLFSSAIAAVLSLGYTIKDAIVIAKMYANRAERKARFLDNNLQLFHGGWPEDECDLPYLAEIPLLKRPKPFKRCIPGFYPVVDSSRWIKKLLEQGVRCMQLRIKQMENEALLEEEIKQSVSMALQYNATLFINDHWERALRLGAKGVHLGQEDLQTADIEAILAKDLYLGISTHCYYEVARAHAINPSYIACGPIYATTSKIMPFAPQGIPQLERWRRTLQYPLVAIGGINLERLPEILKSGVDGIALISAVTEAKEPDKVIQLFLRQIASG